MVRIEGGIEINRPIHEVFDFVADQSNEPTYNPRMVRAQQATAGPVGLGTRFWATTRTLGRTTSMLIEVTEYVRPVRLASSTHLASMDIRGALTFEPVGGGTRMQWTWDVEPRGVYTLMSPLVALQGRRQEQAVWAGLKRVLEADTDHPTGAGPEPSWR